MQIIRSKQPASEVKAILDLPQAPRARRSRNGRRRVALGNEPIYLLECVFRWSKLRVESQRSFEVFLSALEIMLAEIGFGPAEERFAYLGSS